MNSSLLIFKIYRWSYRLKSMPTNWISLILGLIFLIPFIVFRTVSLVTLLIPGYPKSNGVYSVLVDYIVSWLLLTVLIGLIISPFYFIYDFVLFNEGYTNFIVYISIGFLIFVTFMYLSIVVIGSLDLDNPNKKPRKKLIKKINWRN